MKKKKEYKFGTCEVVFLVVITCVLSFGMSALIFNKTKTYEEPIKDENITEFTEQYYKIINNYYGKLDKKKLIDSAIKGMVESLDDPNANYFNQTEAKNFNIRLDGYYTGLGIEFIKMEDDKIYILNVFEGSNAEKKGIQIGDMIVSVDGKSVEKMTAEDLVEIVNKNGKVKIKVERNEESFEVEIEASRVNIKSVYSTVENVNNKNIGYIRVDLFALNTYEQFKDCLEDLERKGIEGLVIDLRDNVGGHLSTAHNILSLFLNKDKVIYQIKKNDSVDVYHSNGNTNKEYKIVIMVNQNSASASELMTAALSENLKATIIGKTTFGKGTAQEVITLSNGEQYKFTTKEWLTPSGKSINGVGINPDVECDDTTCMEKALEIFKQ